jgi:DNA-binding transcriptional LysR family regulator
MTITQLKYFQCAADEQHVTNAALKLNISQSALSRTIALLEEEIGFELFQQVDKQVRLTRAGEQYLAHVNNALHALEEGARRARNTYEGRGRNVLVSGTTQFFLDSIARIAFETDPQMQVRTSVNSVKTIENHLCNGMLDFGLSNEMIPSSDIVCEKIAALPLFIVSVYPIADATGKRVSLCDLKKYSFISDREDTSWRDILNRLGKQIRCVFNVAYDNMQSRDIHELQEATGAIMMIPGHVALRLREEDREKIRTGQLFIYLIQEEFAKAEFYLCYSAHFGEDPGMERLLGKIRENFSTIQSNVDRMVQNEYSSLASSSGRNCEK